MNHFERMAQRLSEVAEACAEAGMSPQVLALDQIAEELRRLGGCGVPEHVDPDTTTPVSIPLTDTKEEPP